MPRDPQVLIFVGIKGAALALDDRTGAEVWRTALRSLSYVTVLWDGAALLAATDGEVWRLDPATGGELWHNELKGLGRGLASLASSRQAGEARDPSFAEEKRRRDQAAAASAAG